MQASDLLLPQPSGLYCPPADLYIDPLRPVERALITHGHSDHARAGHGSVLATRETLEIMAIRYGLNFAGTSQIANLGEKIDINGVAFTFFPAGHVLGSAQIAIEWKGFKIVVSGDYKRTVDPTCAPFEPQRCDIFITEATFGLPVFTHPNPSREMDKLIQSIALFPDRAHLVGAYSLGKAQRVIALIRGCGYDAPILLHGALEKLTAYYAHQGIDLGRIGTLSDTPKEQWRGAVILCPPGAMKDIWARKLPDPVHCLASGWMRIRARARQSGVELPLVVSDHADWPELQQTILDTRAAEIWVTHGQEDALVHWCKSQGLQAKPLHLVGYDDGGYSEGTVMP
jgi:putative mRNA 3-end processing factor